jgi:tetratricopeptide (TPR) repeat protein
MRPVERTAAWEKAGLALTALVLITLPLYYLLDRGGDVTDTAAGTGPVFVGSAACRDCHVPEYDLWEGSHHDLAMDVASEESVLGDFENAEITAHGITSRFFRRDDRFFVYTSGPGGEMGEFEITHTFGWFPLQQYLVPFPGGRLQTLPLAWDSRDGKWFRVPPDEPIEPDDWLYWTNAAQNWNGMCAQCHSTNLEKNYDPASDSYATTWSDIDVGCEACHGPGSDHVAWAETPEMGRPQVPGLELARQTSNLTTREHVELCAPCHSRRSAMDDIDHTETELMDDFLPSTLRDGLYFADGQIHDEVYVYGSFTQSKMYQRDVRCSDCHDVHSIERVAEGNALCLQCHRAAQYDTAEHHFHKQEGEEGDPILAESGEVLFAVGTGAECQECHMPGRTYMGNDYRPDHSFRVPDPALSAAIGSPDPCLRCHVDRDTVWSQQTMLEWYGPGRMAHYGAAIAAGRRGDADAAGPLAELATDLLYPVIVRATALELLANYPGAETLAVMELALQDEEPLIRHTAVSVVQRSDPALLAGMLAPMLGDPVMTVRIAAANRLAGNLARFLRPEQKADFDEALAEYIDAMNYSGDFASARYNLGNLYNALGDTEKARHEYQAATRIDSRFYPAKNNLALLFNAEGKNPQAERLLREILAEQPDQHEIAYSLGLLLVEMEKYDEALVYLEQASENLPGRARIHFNLGKLYLFMSSDDQAESKLGQALALEPGNLEYQYTLAEFYLQRGQLEQARPIVERMVSEHPDVQAGRQMLEFIRQGGGREDR